MKKSLILTLAILFSALGGTSLAFACVVEGEDVDTDEKCVDGESLLVSPEGEELLDESMPDVLSDDVYAEAGADLKSSRSLFHSFFLAGNSIDSSDSVDGVAAFAGNIVNFSGDAEYAALAGNSVKVSGSVGRDLFVAGNSIEIDEDASIGRDIFAAGSSVIVRSMLYGNVFMRGNRLVLENVTIDGDLDVLADEIVIKGQSSVNGVFRYNDNASITGLDDLVASSTETVENGSSSGASDFDFASTLSSWLMKLVGRLILMLVVVSLAPKFAKKLLESFRLSTSWKHLGLGLLFLVFTPLAAILTLITVIGAPVALLAICLYGVFALLSSVVTGGVVGNEITNRFLKKSKLNLPLKYALGISVVWALSLIPVLGGLVSAVSICFGFGYLAKRVYDSRK